MGHPQPITCDICEKPIPSETVLTTVSLPLPADVADDIESERKKQTNGHPVFGYINPRPSHIHLDVCPDCVNPSFAPAAALKVIKIRDQREGVAV